MGGVGTSTTADRRSGGGDWGGPPDTVNTVTISDASGVLAAAERLSNERYISYDLETTGLDPHTDSILLAQFNAPGTPVYVVVCSRVDVWPLVSLLADPARIVLAHNASFEYQFTLANYGIRLGRVYCSKVAEQVLTAGKSLPAALENTVARRLGVELDKTQQQTFVGVDPEMFCPTDDQIQYAARDVALLPALRRAQIAVAQREGLVKTISLELAALPVFADMELAGLRLDTDAHALVLAEYVADADRYGAQAVEALEPYWESVQYRQLQHYQREYQQLTEQLDDALGPYGGRLTAGVPDDVRRYVAELRKRRMAVKPKPEQPINLASGQQVLAALAESGITLPNLQSATVADNIHRSPVLAAYAQYTKARKIVTTYGQSLADRVHTKTGRVHGSYNQVVSTGRTSSSQPNMQNMPKRIRQCFVPDRGNVFVVADFANMELRIAAGLSGDAAMVQAFRAGIDLHCLTAATTWTEQYQSWQDVPRDSSHRQLAKIVNFAAIYGASAGGLVHAGVPDKATAERLLAGFEAAYPTLTAWIRQNGDDALITGYAETALGRKRYFERLPPCPNGYAAQREWRRWRESIRRAAMNHPVQGTGADIAKRALVLIWERLRDHGPRVVGMVHDEILVECLERYAKRVAEVVADAMQCAGVELVPAVDILADVHIVDRWEK